MKKIISLLLSLTLFLTAVVTVNADGPSDWAKEEVDAAVAAGLVPEELQKNYTSPVTRGQVAEMFIVLLEKTTGRSVSEIIADKGALINRDAFTDTSDENVFSANALGIINGTGNNRFTPGGTLKRAQIAAVINRVAAVIGIDTEGHEHGFIDITDNYEWAGPELGWPVYAGIINGMGGNRFNPGGDLTTEQAILITYRAFRAFTGGEDDKAELKSEKAELITDTMDMTEFDRRFLTFISEHTEGNYMTSPLSFRYALGLLLAGAAGDTKAELLDALGVGSEEEWIRYCLTFNGFTEYFALSLEREIEETKLGIENGWIDEDSELPFRALRVANSVWKNQDISEGFKKAYGDSVTSNYGAEYRSFTSANAVEKINEWADTKTEHMIPELLPDDYPTDDLAVVLMNALYFKDAWENGFTAGLTEEGDFYAADGKITKKEYMTAENHCGYYEDEETKLVILHMKGGVSMAFVLGSAENISEKISVASYEKVSVTIPKLDLETSFSSGELVDFLREYGVERAFDGGSADFSEMIDYPVYVSDIIQKTRIKLDEDGVEAAAVTAILMQRGALIDPDEPKVFRADRPFTFYIYTTCNDTTAVMFAGEIVE